MTWQSKEPLRELTSEERRQLEKLARSRSEVAEVVTRAKSLIAVADGAGFAAGARAAGRKSGYGVGKLVARFNRAGMGALHSKPSYGHRVTYTADLRARVLAEFRRAPDRELDGTVNGDMVADDTATSRAEAARLGEDQSRHD